ncbi:MAG: hypothetical protein ABSH07_07255 [Candidatus Dormibacteria bacterium]
MLTARGRALARVCGAPAGYLVAAIALTLPVWGHPATEWPGGPGDPMLSMGFLGWNPFALSHGLNPLHDTFVNLPAGVNMTWDTTMPLASVVLWPVTALFGVIAAYNTGMAAALALDGWCTFLWLRRRVRLQVAAWIGGLMMVLGPFAASRASAHLDLLLFFPVPLLLIALENAIRGPRRPLRWGAVIGLLCAVQFFLTEEVLALFVVAVGTAVVIAAALFPRAAAQRALPLAQTLGVAVGLFLLLTAFPLAYQLFGPGRIVGPIQTPNTYVTDLVNLVVPTSATALSPPFTTGIVSQWTGFPIEADAYIGIPLLLVGLYTAVRWWGDRWLRIVALGACAAVIWSLGPYLHVAGVSHHVLPLPGRLLAHVPVLANLLPARFDLFLDLGLAALLAVFVDRVVLAGRWRSRLMGGVALALVVVTLAPRMPLAATSSETPPYFISGGDVTALAPGTTALVVPYGDSSSTMEPLLWQAQSGFRFRMVSGTIWTAGPGGAPSFGRPATTTLDCVMNALQTAGTTSGCGSGLIGAVRADLDRLGVRVLILGPLNYGNAPYLQAPIEDFLTQVAGAPPRSDQGVEVWAYGG